jgi:hypothetical protein
MAKFLAALLAISLCASGCGGGHKQSKAERAAMNAEFAKIDFGIAQYTMGPAANDPKALQQLTRRYVVAIRKYRDDLGDPEVNRRLTHEADQVAPWCLPCVEILRHESEAG